jgi:hypothetical protein
MPESLDGQATSMNRDHTLFHLRGAISRLSALQPRPTQTSEGAEELQRTMEADATYDHGEFWVDGVSSHRTLTLANS